MGSGRAAAASRGIVWAGPRLASAVALALAAPLALAGPAFGAVGPADGTRAAAAGSDWQSGRWGDRVADWLSSGTSNARYDAARDPGSLYTITKAIGARQVWNQYDDRGRHITGQGVTVALLDTGVQPVQGLSGAGKLVYGPDLSLEHSQPELTDQDTFGHGTHMAGIIAAHDPGAATTGFTDPQAQLGVAPDATVLPVKLATADGATDVSQVIAALDWVVQHRNDDPAHPIRVVNLSYGTDSKQDYRSDPLAAAAENAWRHGIVVVVSAGNEGQTAAGLTDPAIDPYVLAVGASDPQERTDYRHLGVADFSSRGTAERPVDLVAPGTSVVSLRDPGSYLDQNHPEGLVDNDTSGRLFRGSGTSQAAAVASGAVALLLQDHPELTPDQVKGLLMANADQIAGDAPSVGAGELDIDGTIAALDGWSRNRLLGRIDGLRAVQTYPISTGHGSLEAARGGSYVYDPDSGVPLTGEQDVQGNAWDGAAWWAAASLGQAWQGGKWLGTVWSGDGWTSSDGVVSWVNADWTGARWSGARWSGARWSGARWSGARWSGARWSGARWSGARWSDADWSGARWSGARWSGARWSGDSWGAEA